MNVIDTALLGVKLIEPDVHGDSRGWFSETWTKKKLEDAGIFVDFVQDNQSFTKAKDTLRGIHFQKQPFAQTKLVRVVAGAVRDVVVDLRRGSPTYLTWAGFELTRDNHRQLLIPKGCGHAFLTLTDDVEFVYKVDNYYSPACDRSIRFDDPDLGIDWGLDAPVLSDKDLAAPFLRDSDVDFVFDK